jgi:protein-S-isoprenylcysteine O-methyltransferase Ste14
MNFGICYGIRLSIIGPKNIIMEILGKSPINPILFFTGKIGGYVTWVVAIYLSITNGVCYINPVKLSSAVILAIIGFIFLVLSSIFLGGNVRMGLPSKETNLKTNGIYKISRNPMYIGLHLITLSSIIYTMNLYVFVLGLYSIFVYHQIILSEEKFLSDCFGDNYSNYKQKVRRYF